MKSAKKLSSSAKYLSHFHGVLPFAGKAHKFTVLSDLVGELKKGLNTVRDDAQQREAVAERLVRDTMKQLNEWDEATRILVNQLHQARDKSVSFLFLKCEC